jgi:hypothetical protein
MESLLAGLCVFELGVIAGLIGYAFKTRSDASGWKTSYEREKERADQYADAERDTKLAAAIGAKFVEALGQLPKSGTGG